MSSTLSVLVEVKRDGRPYPHRNEARRTSPAQRPLAAQGPGVTEGCEG